MLAEIYLLKLEAAVRAAKEAATTASTSRFVPVTLPAGKASYPRLPSRSRHLPAAARRTPRIQNNSGLPPRTCHGVGGRLRMRRTDCEGGSPRVRYTTARFRDPAWLRRGSGMAARGSRAAADEDRSDWDSRFGVGRCCRPLR